MKTFEVHLRRGRHPADVGWRRLLVVLSALLLVGVPSFGAGGTDDRGGSGAGMDDGTGDDDTMSDDETVGTLPIVVGDGPGIDPLMSLDRVLSFRLRGSEALLAAAILDASGDGYVEKRHLEGDVVELVFNGTVEIVLDPFLFHAGIDVHGVYGWRHAGAPAAVIATDFAAPRLFHLGASRSLALPVDRMVRGGLLDTGESVQIHAALLATRRSVLSLRNDGSFFVLSQG